MYQIERFHLRCQHPCKFIGRKELNSHRIVLGRQCGRRFSVFGQHGCRDVMLEVQTQQQKCTRKANTAGIK